MNMNTLYKNMYIHIHHWLSLKRFLELVAFWLKSGGEKVDVLQKYYHQI